MPKAALAQVGQGDPNVVAHPGFRTFPACRFTLTTQAAIKEYGEIGRLLWNAGRLSLDAHISLSNYAKLFDQIQQIESEGLTPRASWFSNLQKAQARLKLDDLDKPISAPKEAPVNKFAFFGFEARR